jgi:amicoumacin kinase
MSSASPWSRTVLQRQGTEPTFAKELISAISNEWSCRRPEFIRWFDNVVYRASCDDSVVYLRLTPTKHRSRAQIDSELELLRFLGDREFASTRPIPANSGAMSFQCQHGGDTVVACAFTECGGSLFQDRPPSDLGWFCQTVGNTLGNLHKVLRDFEPSKTFTRMAWNEERWDLFAEVLPEREAEAWELHLELSQWWESIASSNDYGLVHGDFTVRNMHYNDAGVSLFDFDCCCEHWYAYDIACFLHFFSQYPRELRRIAYERTLAGYAEASNLSQDMIEQIPNFSRMKVLRGFLVYAIYFGLENPSPALQQALRSRRRLLSEPAPWPAR